jgi:prephenate dehydrogenase
MHFVLMIEYGYCTPSALQADDSSSPRTAGATCYNLRFLYILNSGMFDKLVIFGVGLIGGSVALTLRQSGSVRRIVGVGRTDGALDEALRLGVIDEAAAPADAVKNADLILLAIPVGQMPGVMATIAPHLGPHAVITDAGSTKCDVIAAARNHLGQHLPGFVPSHPIAGAEKSGVTAARANLFIGKNAVLTPLPETNPQALERVSQFWQACGAKVSIMTPELHERIFATVSHLPHLLAFALVDEIARRPNAEQLFGFAAGGFRDFSRIAGSSPEMWRDICLANRDAMLAELDAFQAQLSRLRAMIERGDGAALEAVFNNARDARDAWAHNLQSKINANP